ncbi:MAG: hypothetical protein K1X75_08055 [Leptospirales bacterium]|nr:hypothetical protein [Leptospirales bacterium]
MRFLTILIVLLLAAACAAKPQPEDLQRVKKTFLVMRFNAAFDVRLKGLSDRTLFEESCRQNAVRVEETLQLLKENDPAFYSQLMATSPEEGPERAVRQNPSL